MTILDGKALLDHSKSIARRHGGRLDAESARDLGAEAVLRALRSPAPDGNMQPWLERIFHNLLVDTWRRPAPAPLPMDEAIASGGETPEESLLRHERRQLVRARLARLPREARQALLVRYYGELEPALVATRLGVAPATVRTRIHRGLQRLRMLLADLRALCPPGFANLTSVKSSALALAPVLMVALTAVETGPSLPESAPVLRASTSNPPISRRVSARDAEQAQVVAPAIVEPRLRARPLRVPPIVLAQAEPASVQRFDFEKDDVEGDIQRPDEDLLHGDPPPARHQSLIEIPVNFVGQFEKMIEDRL